MQPRCQELGYRVVVRHGPCPWGAPGGPREAWNPTPLVEGVEVCPGEGQADGFGGLEVGGAGWEPGRRFCGCQGVVGATPGQVASRVGRPGGAGMGMPAWLCHVLQARRQERRWSVLECPRGFLSLVATQPPSVCLHMKLHAGACGIMLLCLCNYTAHLSKLIELISDNAVCSLPVGWISFLSARSVRPAWELGAGLLAFGVTVGRGSLRRAGHPHLSALHSRGCLVPREVSRVADAEHVQEGRNWGRL